MNVYFVEQTTPEGNYVIFMFFKKSLENKDYFLLVFLNLCRI